MASSNSPLYPSPLNPSPPNHPPTNHPLPNHSPPHHSSPDHSPPNHSPRIRIPRRDYVGQSPYVPRSRSVSANSSPTRSLRRAIPKDSGLGIQMKAFPSPTSPDSVYRTTPQTPGIYSPLPSYSYDSRPKYAQTPDTVHSFGSPLTRSRTDPATQFLIQHRATQAAQWKIHWRTPTLMVLSFLTGIILAISQHVLYQSLHHRAEDNEGKKVRVVLYGRALAYFSKVAFCSCLILCYRQRIWRTFREQSLSLWSIDQIFLATEDASLFLNWETLSKATLVTSMAFVIWMIPIATIIFSPGALTFGDYLEVGSSIIPVPTLNFSVESIKNWRDEWYDAQGKKKKSLRFENTTAPDNIRPPGWFDYYDQPSSDLKRIAMMSGWNLKSEPQYRQDARRSSCGGDFNCTYTVSFDGPGYKCEDMAKGVGDDTKLIEAGAPFTTSQLSPEGDHIYFAAVDNGGYSHPQTNDFDPNYGGGVPAVITEDLGVLKSEPVLWIGYSLNTSEPLPADSPFRRNWTHLFEPRVFRCTHYETRYTVEFSYTGPFSMSNISSEFRTPIINTTFPRHAENNTLNYNLPGPAENFIRPSDVELYRKTSSYIAMGESLRNFLRGSVVQNPPIPGPEYAIVHSDFANTRLCANNTGRPLPELSTLIQDYYANMILSLLSNRHFIVVNETRVLVNTTRYRSTFVYNPRQLWACYIPVISVAFGFLLLGAWTIYQDGTTFSDGFSRILVTTRNSTLDDISRGACLGNDPFPRELMNTKLQFGVLNDESVDMEYMASDGPQLHHCTFGVPSEIIPIVKGEPYAGLPSKKGRKLVVKEKVD